MEHANGCQRGEIMKQEVRYLRMGEDIEKKGISFYSNALKRVVDPNSKGLLKFLIGEEKNHLAYLEALEKKINDGKGKVRIKRMKNPVFSKAAYKNIKGDRANTLNIFNTALDIEMRSAKLYGSLSKKTKDKEVKKLLLDLVRWETVHFRLIKTHQDAIYRWMYWEMRTQERIEM